MEISREKNIISVRFDDHCHLAAPSIFQYNKGQVMRFLDIPDGVEVQFSNAGLDRTENKIIMNGQVEIPDFLIAEGLDIKAYMQYIDENSETTIKTIDIPVKQRTQAGEDISEDDQPTFRQEIQAIMNSTKAIADDVEQRANNGEFNGKDGRDGVDGKDGKDGNDYVLTESDKSAIAEIAGNMLDYVPPTRTIANLTLDQDIATDVLAAMLYPEVLSQGKTVIKGYAKEDIDTLLSATSNNAIANSTVYALQQALQADINANYNDILALQNKDKWELVLDKTLPGTSTDKVLLDFDDLTLDGTYKELRIIIALWATSAGNINIYANGSTDILIKLLGALETNATYCYDIVIGNALAPNRYLECTAEKAKMGVNTDNSAVSTYRNWSDNEEIPDMASITSLKIEMTTGRSNSSDRILRVYGRK